MHAVYRCGLLLQMSHVAWSVCRCVYVLVTRVSCVKTAELIELPFDRLTRESPRKHILYGDPNPLRQGAFLRDTYSDPL